MMTSEIYPCYVRVGESIGCEELVEVPTEKDGTMLLSTLTAQFPDAVGLRFKAASGAWRGIRCNDNIMDPPAEGWGDGEYLIVKHGMKRKFDSSEDETPAEKLNRMTEKEILSDLITLGLPYSASERDVKAHFEEFGEVEMCEIKYDSNKKSRGFGFIRYKSVEAVEKALKSSHIIHNRRVELRFPKEDLKRDDNPTKLFIGRLPRGSTVEDLQKHFSQYGVLKDAYIPEPFRGFGFVTFASQSAAREVMDSTHVIKGTFVNVSHPSPKNDSQQQMKNENQGYGNMPGNGFGNMPGNSMQGNNMQRNGMQGMQGMQGQNTQGQNMQGNRMQSSNMQSMQGNKGYMQGNMSQPGPGYGYGTLGNNTSGYNNQVSGKTSTGNYRWGNA